MILFALFALLLPGLAWWAWIGKRNQDPLISLAQILGVSFSTIIILAELGYLLDVRFSLVGIMTALAAFALAAAAGLIYRGIKLPKKYHRHFWIGLGLVGMAVGWRLYQASDLLLPNWVDSQHHYLIVRVILEQGGIPDNLFPYFAMPFIYHFGFHAVAALFTVLSGLEISQSMLVLGQVLNAAIGLSVYVLAKSLWRDWRPAAAAGLLATFVTRMPAYYLSWGRYTLTMGLILLPLAMGVAFGLIRKKHHKWDVVTLAVLTAGLLLSHYFAAALLALFLVILALGYLLPRLGKIRTAFIPIKRLIIASVAGLLLAAPWLWRAAQLSPKSTNVKLFLPESVKTVLNLNGNGSWGYIWQILGPLSNYWLMLAAGTGLFAALIFKKSKIFGVWSLTLGVMTLPIGLTLQPFRPDHFAIVLFLPVTLWAGWLFWQVGDWLGERLNRRWISFVLIALAVAGWSVWSFPLSSNIVNNVTVLVTPADLSALDWVEENTPEDARFYINTTYWLNNVYRGVDGGGWLLPITGRWSLVPTVFYSLSANPIRNQALRRWGETATQITTCSEDFWNLVDEADLGWIYIRSGVGSLQRSGLTSCQGLREVYRNQAVTIYRVDSD